jgi:hypothetical protein
VRRTALAIVAVSAAALASAPAADAASFVMKLKTPRSQPRVNKGWKITVIARTRSGRALRARAYYQFLYNGQVVSVQYPSPGRPPGSAHKPYRFRGRYSDKLVFPPRSRGIPLKLRVVVKVKGRGTKHRDKRIRVRR